MFHSSRYLDPALVEQLNHLQFAARRVVEGTATGLHRSPVKGGSIEFRQHRAYAAGDEPRRLDWRVLARTDRPFIKEYDEETNLHCLLMLDCSGSMAYGRTRATGASKFDYAAKLTASLAYLMLAASESVGMAILGDGLSQWLTPRGGSKQLSSLTRALHDAAPRGTIDLKRCTEEVAGRLGRRAVVILISDFFSSPNVIREAMARLGYNRHEVICLRVLHPDEVSFPFKNWSQFRGLEGERSRLCEPAMMRSAYLAGFDRHTRELRKLLQSASAEFHPFVTDRPLIDSLTQFLRFRARR